MTQKAGSVTTRLLDYTIVFLAVTVGGSSLVATGLFLLQGPLFFIDLGLGQLAKQLFNAALCLMFFTQHSGMIRQSIGGKMFMVRNHRYYAALYSIATGISLWILFGLWQSTGNLLFAFDGVARLVVQSLFLWSIIGFVWGNISLGHIDTLGIEAVLRLKKTTSKSRVPEMSIKGPYRFVRHPLYFCSLMMIWSFPDWTADRLLFNILWSGWIVAGARWEELDLVNFFGEPYEDYQRRVPMLIPFTKIR